MVRVDFISEEYHDVIVEVLESTRTQPYDPTCAYTLAAIDIVSGRGFQLRTLRLRLFWIRAQDFQRFLRKPVPKQKSGSGWFSGFFNTSACVTRQRLAITAATCREQK